MAKCANCVKDANYTVADPGVNPVNYCAACLPKWLRDRANQGHFPLPKVEVKAPVVEEPVVEEVVVEPVVEEVVAEETPAKTTKKKTASSPE